MNARICAPVLCIGLLAACSGHDRPPDGATVIDETVALTRDAHADSATRKIEVTDEALLVAVVDEQLTDVRLKLAATDSRGKQTFIEVENNLRGAALEIATLAVPAHSQVTVTLTGLPDANAPGKVPLRVTTYSPDAEENPRFSARLAGLTAWSDATNASFRTDAIKKMGLANMERAIGYFDSTRAEAALAAEARLIRANMFHYFEIDNAEARAEAQRAGKAFSALPNPNPLKIARAKFEEAKAYSEFALDLPPSDPAREVANEESRLALAELCAESSALGPIERARAMYAIGYIDVNLGRTDDARKHFEAAKAIYHSVGYPAGELEMSAAIARSFVDAGRYEQGARAYDAVLPEVDRMANRAERVKVFIRAAHGQLNSGRTDEATINQLKALALAREYQLRSLEASSLQGLGNTYLTRGDFLQSAAFYAEALKINRQQSTPGDTAFALESAGTVARKMGDYTAAIAMHREAAEIANNPVGRVRFLWSLAMDYIAMGDYPEAVTQLRASLAVKLPDPTHHAFTDVKRTLADQLIEHGDGARASLDEAARLLSEALTKSEGLHDKVREISAHRTIARLYTKQDKPAAALAEYRKTFKLIFEHRNSTANPELRAATLESEQSAFRGYFDLVMAGVPDGPGRLKTASPGELGALRTLELARDSHFGPTTVKLDPEGAARVDSLFTQMADKSLAIATLLKTAPKSAQLPQLQLDMAQLRTEIDRERTAAALKEMEHDKATANVVRTWRPLAPGAVELSYALGNDHAYVWARSAAGTHVAVLSETPEAIERELTELAGLDRQSAPESVERSLAHLSTVLLPRGLLSGKSTAVEIIAEGRIASVPFAGLHSPSDPARRLAETHAITMITSMFAVDEPPRPKQARPFRLVALASGGGTLRSVPVTDPSPRLGAAKAEISAIGKLFEAHDPAARVKLLAGSDGSSEALRGIWSSGADVVHFATHALADLRQPLASLLVLPATNAAGTATYLTAGQVQGWHGDADLVFLSACDSAVGPPRFAAGMPGLQRAFLRAGARGVIATLWPIEDVFARKFSEDFYTRYTSGRSAAQALSETQQAWLVPQAGASDADQMRRRITALAHAYFAK